MSHVSELHELIVLNCAWLTSFARLFVTAQKTDKHNMRLGL